MGLHLKIIYTILLTLIAFNTSGQAECDSISEPKFDRIFGAGPYSKIGIDTIITTRGYTVSYSCWDCNLKGIRPNGKIKWEFDLSEFGCQLSQFISLELEDVNKYSKYDFAFGFDNLPPFCMNSKTGRYTLYISTDE